MKKSGLSSIIDSNTKVLILGSLPSDESIRQQKYYANPGNDFWKLISAAMGDDITGLDYDARIASLKEHGIGLWDVFGAGERKGSMDSGIKEEEVNDFSQLRSIAPNIRLVCFNGKKAGEGEHILKKLGFATKLLPSSSGANRRYSEKRILEWKSIFNC